MKNKKTLAITVLRALTNVLQYEESELIDAFCSKKSWGREDEYAWNSEID